MPLDVPPKKDVNKEGDKPQEHGADTQQSRLLLSLEASKKPEHKPEQKATTKASDESMAAYISSGIDKASSLLTDAVAMLPTLTLDDTTKPKSTDKVDISSFLKENCKADAKNEACKVTTVDSGFTGFVFKTDKPLVEDKKVGANLSTAETKLSASDWNKLFAAYDSQNSTAGSQVERTANGLVHRDATGKADVVRGAGNTKLRTADGGILNASDAGDKVKVGPDGKIQFSFDKDRNFRAALDGGTSIVIERGSELAYFVDANGNRYGQVFNRKDGGFQVYGEYKNGNLVVTNDEMKTKGGLAKIVETASIEAAKLGKSVTVQADGGMVIVGADKSFIALQNDGSSIVSMPDGRYLVRNGKGDLSICSPDGSTQEISKEFLASIRESKREELRALRTAAAQLVQFSTTHTLHGTDGKASLTMNNNTLTGHVVDSFHTSQKDGVTTTTNIADGSTQTVDIKTKEVVNTDAKGNQSRIEAKPNGQFKITTKNYTYDSGTVTTKEGDVFSANHVRLANGTELDSNNTVTMADGTTMRADGSYTSQSRGKAEMVMASKAAESKAASIAGYAEGMAGAIRSRAASGHATASDIASLESVFAGLCDAVASLGMVGDPSVSFKLYSAKGTVSESISSSRSNLNSNKAA
ncbi:MAG: hypothetical protein WC028_25795 [Candidatus Obscuribacterales bacterium]